MGFLATMALDFFVAFGVVFGASMLAGIGAVFTLHPPTITMQHIAENIKIWAVVAAIGGTIDPIRVIESNFLVGQLSPALKQILYILSAFVGAHLGTKIVAWVCNGGVEP
ncbi:MAG TPA: YtrH family sporulation protein [Bacilli bacterium]